MSFLSRLAGLLGIGTERGVRGVPYKGAATRKNKHPKHKREARREHRANTRENDQKRQETRDALATLQGNPPGYMNEHRDQLVRRFGTRKANQLEAQILSGQLTFLAALAHND